MKFYEIIERYIVNERTDVSMNTRSQTRLMLSLVLEDLERHGVTVDGLRVEGLDGLVMSDWKGRMAAGKKPATVNCYIAIVRPFLRWMAAAGLAKEDYGAGLRGLKVLSPEYLPEDQRPREKYLTHEQAQALLETHQGYNRLRDRAIAALILYTGLRTEELCALNVGDFRGEKAGRGAVEVKRKGGRYKLVPIPEPYYPYLDQYLATRPDAEQMDAPLFLTSHGKRCSRKQVYKALSHKQDALGLATGGHALRHTFVSEVEKLGGAGVARDLANHSSLKITNRYTHTTPQQRMEVVSELRW